MRKHYAIIIVLVLVGGVLGTGSLLVSRGFSARAEPTSLEAWLAGTIRWLSIPRAARNARNPVSATPEVLTEARAHFADHCAICHANDGSGQTDIGQNLYPRAPDMRLSDTQNLTDGELYYIIHNGLRLTGMPAWGEEASDEDSWNLVHFIRHLPRITEEELAEMERLNPKSPAELAEEREIEDFLRGEPTGAEHDHK